jgi:hypothetical protein
MLALNLYLKFHTGIGIYYLKFHTRIHINDKFDRNIQKVTDVSTQDIIQLFYSFSIEVIMRM